MSQLNLRAIASIILLITVVSIAIAIRLSVAASDIPLLGDAKTRYDPIAKSLLAGHGFSRDNAPPYRADNFDQPGYPLLIATVYAISNRSTRAVVLFQLLLELLILLPVIWIARELKLSRKAQILAVAIGLICPFLAKYAGLLLSEVLATLVIMFGCYTFMRSVRESQRNNLKWWALAGLASGVTLLIRADTLIVVGLMSAVAIILARPPSVKSRILQASVLVISIVLTLTPWTVRNYLQFRAFKPLGSVSVQAGFPYVKWLNTWLDSPADLKPFWWDAMKADQNLEPFPAAKIPDADERNRAWSSLVQGREQRSMRGEPNRQFQELANEARRKRPLQTFVMVPVRRLIKTLLYPQINRVPTLMGTRLPFFSIQILWLLLLGFSLLGVVLAIRLKRYAVLLLVAVIIGRLLLPLISGLGADPRLLVEILPVLYVLAALGISGSYEFIGAKVSPVSPTPRWES
jgi:4-amino-4-deoxy-L-arabinose transferase-like glycosyltransferase